MLDEIDRRNLTDQEYNNLSVELKVCFYLQGWNISANIHSVEDWINTFYIWYDTTDEYDVKPKDNGIKNITEEYTKLFNFVSSLLKETK